MTQDDPRILELRRMREQARLGGGADRIKRQHAKGKLTARERLERLLAGGTFNELEPFITHQGAEMGLATEKYLGEGVITGYGQIDGRTVYVYAQDFTVYGARSAKCRATRSSRRWTHCATSMRPPHRASKGIFPSKTQSVKRKDRFTHYALRFTHR